MGEKAETRPTATPPHLLLLIPTCLSSAGGVGYKKQAGKIDGRENGWAVPKAEGEVCVSGVVCVGMVERETVCVMQ